jgi:LuxR family maltose regulon positive regulatory protein
MLAHAAVQLADVPLARASLSRASRVLRRLSDAPEFRTLLDSAWAEIDERGASALSGPAALTLAELRILRFLPTHLSFREIGERLHVSTNTVKTQAHAVYGKLDAASRSEAVDAARALGLIQAAVV